MGELNCSKTTKLLSAYLDRELPGHEMLAVRQHLSTCTGCQLELEALKGIKQAAAQMPEVFLDPAFEARLFARVESERLAKKGWSRTSRLTFAAVAVGAVTAAFLTHIMMTREELQAKAPVESIPFNVQRDQIYATGSDPLHGSASLILAGHGSR